MLNDPFRGGTHLPDITVVAPVFVRSAQHKMRRAKRSATPEFFVAARAHHADVGGTYAGSMGPCREIYQEGFRIPPVKIVRGGTLDRDILALLLNNVRTPEEREGDLSAQLAACHTGGTRLRELCTRYGIARVQRAAHALLDYSEKMMRAFLATVPAGTYAADDVLDDDGVTDDPVRIAVRITFPRATKSARNNPRPVVIDFTGSSPQVEGSINAVEAITYSACFYVFRCLLREDVPATAGLMRPIHLIAPEGTVVNARPPAAVAGGNVETSQRIVDVLLRALAQALPEQIPAASSGTMNNLTIGGMDDRPATRSGSLQHVSTMALEGARLQGLLKNSAGEPFVSGHDFSRADNQRLLKNSASERFVSGHDFSRADKSFSSCHPEEAFRPTRDLRFRLRNPVSRSISAGVPRSSLPLARAGQATMPGSSHPESHMDLQPCHKDEEPSSSVILSEESGRPGDRTRSRRTPISPAQLRVGHLSTERSVSGVEGPAVLAGAGPAIPFAYYETVAGGSGASATHDGVSGIHTHMTNSLNTPAEALEYSYPLRVTKYALRRGSQGVSSKGDTGPNSSPQGDTSVAQGVSPGSAGVNAPESLQGRHIRSEDTSGSGGAGKHRGGDGIVREIEVLTDATVTILSDRRKSRPYGLAGGEPGAPGRTVILRADGSTELMPSKGSTRLRRGERVRIETPGGGGWGRPAQDGEDNSD